MPTESFRAETKKTESKDSPLSPEQQKMVEDHLRLVHHIARGIFTKIVTAQKNIEYQELVSAGILGLIDAVKSFNKEAGFSFSTFATPRIRGAILDELRNGDEKGRYGLEKHMEITQAEDELRAKLGRPPKEKEVAKKLQITLERLHKWKRDLNNRKKINYDNVEDLQIGKDDDIQEKLEIESELDLVKKNLKFLSPKEARVLSLFYIEEMSIPEISRRLGITEVNASVTKLHALQKLRRRMSESS